MASTTILATRAVQPKAIFERRIHEVDLIRGILIIFVVIDHIFWNLKHYGGIWYDLSNETNFVFRFFQDFFGWYWTSSARAVIQPIILMTFCFISGISCAFSRDNWKRAIQTLTAWLVLATTTNIAQLLGFFPNQGTVRIDFNIIAVLGLSTLFYCLVQKRSWKALAAGTLISLMISLAIPYLGEYLMNIEWIGYSEVVHAEHVQLVPNVYFPLFWEPAEMFGGSRQADYVPLFPYIMFFFGGALISYFLYKKRKKSLFPAGNWEKPICFLGRHTFLIYIGHQAVLMGIFIIVNSFIQAFY